MGFEFTIRGAALMAMLGSGVLAAALVYLVTVPGHRTPERWWALAFVLQTGRYAIVLADPLLEHPLAFAVAQSAQAFGGLCLLAGALAYRERPVPRLLFGALAAGVVLWTVLGYPWLGFVLTTGPLFVGTGLVMIFAGLTLLRVVRPAAEHEAGAPWGAQAVAGGIFVLWGLHKADYPLLRLHPTGAPLGFLLAFLLAVAAAVTLIIVTQRRQHWLAERSAQQALASEQRFWESERRFRRLIEETHYGILIHRNQRPLYVNPAFARMFGYDSPEEVLTLDSIDHWVAPHDLARVRSYADARLSAGISTAAPEGYEYDGKRRDGSLLRVHNSVRTIEWEGEPALMATMSDVTEAHHAHEAVRQSESRLRNLIEGSIQGIVIIGGRRPLFCNQAYARMFGYDSPEEVLALESVDALNAPHDRERIQHYASARLAGRDAPVQYELQGLRRDGTLVWLECIATAVVWDGKPAIQATLIDITARKRAEEDLRASQRLLQTVFDTIPHLLSVKAPDSRLLMANRAVAAFHGRSAEQMRSVVKPTLPHRPEAEWERLLDEDRWVISHSTSLVVERELTRWDGVSRYMQSYKSPLVDDEGKVIGLVVLAVDITEQKQAQARAEAAHARLIDAIESLPAAFLLFDPGERLVLWNSKCRDFLPVLEGDLHVGLSYADLVRASTAGVSLPADTGAEAWVEARVTGFRRPGEAVEYRLRDGRWLRALDRRTQDGGTVSLRFDVTEAKLREGELRHAQKMDAVGKLTGGVAHDFNNLLQVITGYTTLALSQVGPEDDLYAYMDKVREATDRAAGLTRQLLAFSRKQVLHPADLDLNSVVKGMVDMLQRVLGERVVLDVRLAPRLANIHGDRPMLEQVLLNIIINARDAMPEGGRIVLETLNVAPGTATASMDDTPLPMEEPDGEQSAAPDGTRGWVCLVCTDTGIGMSPEVQERLFEPFFTTKPLGEGTGLGLATVYGIVRQHHGRIEVDSQSGAGATFRIFLPALPPRLVASEEVHAQAEADAGGRTILLAEDDDDVRDLAVQVLSDNGYRVLVAEDGEAAVTAFRDHRREIDLVLLDAVMPRCNGHEAYQRIRADGDRVPVLFSSGYSEDQVEFIAREGLMLLQKPYSPLQLLHAVSTALAGGSRASAL